ncbi:hypothetical protein ACQP3L_33250, partial [Escherichia coli]
MLATPLVGDQKSNDPDIRVLPVLPSLPRGKRPSQERKTMAFTACRKLTPNGSYTYMLNVKYRTSRRQ